MNKDRQLDEFFSHHKAAFDDGQEFADSLVEKMTYYHHYEALLSQLQEERRRRTGQTIIFALSYAVMIFAFFVFCPGTIISEKVAPSLGSFISAVDNAVKAAMGISDAYILIISIAFAGIMTLMGLLFWKKSEGDFR
jgi:hypothetical protein